MLAARFYVERGEYRFVYFVELYLFEPAHALPEPGRNGFEEIEQIVVGEQRAAG